MPEVLNELSKCSLDGDMLPIPDLLRDQFQIFSSSVYIRDSYKSLEDSVEGYRKQVVILDTPGIGKTCFSVYLLWNSLMNRVPTLYHRLNVFYAFLSGHCYKFCSLEDFRWNKIVLQILKDKQAVFI